MSVMANAADNWSDAHAHTTEFFRAPQNSLVFAVTPDGQSFLLLENTSGATDAIVNVVLGTR